MSNVEALNRVFRSVSSELRNETDALMIAVHSCLEVEGFQLVAVDESSAQSSKQLDALPKSWNSSDEVFSFFYRHPSKPGLITVKGLVVDDALILHAGPEKSDDIYCLELRISDFVQSAPSSSKSAAEVYSDVDSLFRSVRVNLVRKLLPDAGKSVPSSCGMQSQQASAQGARPDRWGEGPNVGGVGAGGDVARPIYPDVGRSDLMPGHMPSPLRPGGMFGDNGNMVGPRHPGFGPWPGGFGGGEGGMPGGIGGARFDPIVPPGILPSGVPGAGPFGNRPGVPRFYGNPDNDVFLPPTGRDDMFM